MSADVLRRAASLMRHDVDFGQAYGDDKFLLAVADWLEATAAEHAEVRPDACGMCWPKDGHYPCATAADALAVARAYLGGAS